MWMWSTGINRNIVECKGSCRSGNGTGQAVLIETLWNVKTTAFSHTVQRRSCINRNIVECKGMQEQERFLIISGINRNIVECKGKYALNGLFCIDGINRNIVECKGKCLCTG